MGQNPTPHCQSKFYITGPSVKCVIRAGAQRLMPPAKNNKTKNNNYLSQVLETHVCVFFHSCNSYMQWACLAGSLTGVKRTPTQTCKHLLLPASYALVDLHLRHAVLRSTSGEILQMECRISRIRVAVLSCALVVAWHRPFKVGRVGSSNPELRNTHMVVTSPTLQGGR